MRALPILVLAAAMLGGCATTGTAHDPRDPLEGFNRNVWDFNQAIDKAAVKPAANVYRAVTPVPARRGLSRLLANLMEPLNAVNNLLQGKPDRAFNSLARFVVNTTIGVGGLADHASELGLPPTPEDFGQTLAIWGMKNSPYLVIPLLGPSTIRDGIGTGVGFFIDPPSFLLDQANASTAIEYGVTGIRLLESRSEVIDSGAEAFLTTSADPYAAARDAYFQSRAAEIADQDEGTQTQEQQQEELNKALQENQPGADQPQSEAVPSPAVPAVPAQPTVNPSGAPRPGATVPAPEQAPDNAPAPPKLSLSLPSDESIAYPPSRQAVEIALPSPTAGWPGSPAPRPAHD